MPLKHTISGRSGGVPFEKSRLNHQDPQKKQPTQSSARIHHRTKIYQKFDHWITPDFYFKWDCGKVSSLPMVFLLFSLDLQKGALVLNFLSIKWKTTIRGDLGSLAFWTAEVQDTTPFVVVSLSFAQFLLVHPTIRSTTFPCHWVVALRMIDFEKDNFLSHQILCSFFGV